MQSPKALMVGVPLTFICSDASMASLYLATQAAEKQYMYMIICSYTYLQLTTHQYTPLADDESNNVPPLELHVNSI